MNLFGIIRDHVCLLSEQRNECWKTGMLLNWNNFKLTNYIITQVLIRLFTLIAFEKLSETNLRLNIYKEGNIKEMRKNSQDQQGCRKATLVLVSIFQSLFFASEVQFLS